MFDRMKALFGLVVVAGLFAIAESCTPKRGCTESTADNFDVNADADDGTCIPARDKMIGNYRYTRIWTDTLLGFPGLETGTVQATEANTGHNHFNLNLDGELILQGSISAKNILMETHVIEDTYFGFPWNRTYNGTGRWLTNDTVDIYLELITPVPFLDGNPPELRTIPQIYRYYFKKTP